MGIDTNFIRTGPADLGLYILIFVFLITNAIWW